MSKTVTIPLKTATDEQLRDFATKTLGLDVKYNEKGPSIRAKIQSAYDKPDITIQVEDDPEIIRKPEDVPVLAAGEEPWVTVTINKTEEPGGKDAVFLSVNGRGQYVERGVPSAIRYRYYEVLRHGVKDDIEQHGEGVQIQNVVTPVDAYPHNVNVPASPEAVRAWLKADAEESDRKSRAALAEKKRAA